ncbi:evasin P983-like [Amblyomma americanum]
MKTSFCLIASCLVLFALKGSAYPTENEDDYTDYSPFGCPFPVLANMTHDVKPVGCSIPCNNGTEKLDDNTPCYVIEQEVHHRMRALVKYGNCPLGVCTEGICKPQNKTEDCYKGKEEE